MLLVTFKRNAPNRTTVCTYLSMRRLYERKSVHFLGSFPQFHKLFKDILDQYACTKTWKDRYRY